MSSIHYFPTLPGADGQQSLNVSGSADLSDTFGIFLVMKIIGEMFEAGSSIYTSDSSSGLEVRHGPHRSQLTVILTAGGLRPLRPANNTVIW